MSAWGHMRTFAVQKGMSALPSKADICSAPAHVRYGPKADIANLGGWPSISARWWRSVISLRSIVIRTAKRASEKATAPLGLDIIIVVVPAATRLTVTGFRLPRDLILAARSNAGQYNLGIL